MWEKINILTILQHFPRALPAGLTGAKEDPLTMPRAQHLGPGPLRHHLPPVPYPPSTSGRQKAATPTASVRRKQGLPVAPPAGDTPAYPVTGTESPAEDSECVAGPVPTGESEPLPIYTALQECEALSLCGFMNLGSQLFYQRSLKEVGR